MGARLRNGLLAGVLAIAVVTSGVVALSRGGDEPPMADLGKPPPPDVPRNDETPPSGVRNAIVFVVDDMGDIPCRDTADYLPRSSRWLSERGTCFESATTATPVCCPARAQLQTGQLPHNNGVLAQALARAIDPTHTVQHDLGLAGIHTYGTGKNLNGIDPADYYGPGALGTGFDDFDFWKSYRSSPGSFLLWDDDGEPYRPTDGLTSSQTTARFLDEQLDDHLATGERFFLYGAFFAPHKQGTGFGPDDLPLPSAAHADSRVPPFRYQPERRSADKLPIFAYPPKQPVSYYRALWNARVRSLYDVDDEIAGIFRRLEDAGALDETAVIFVSDNGYSDRGQSNWEGKSTPYPSSTDVPMLAWVPGQPARVATKPVGLIDVAPTLYDLMGVEPGHTIDGHSLVGGHRRSAVYAEFARDASKVAEGESGIAASRVPTWSMVKHRGRAYIEFYGRDGRVARRELYGADDPRMTRNLLYRGYRQPRPRPAVVRAMKRMLHTYARCRGTEESGSRRPCP